MLAWDHVHTSDDKSSGETPCRPRGPQPAAKGARLGRSLATLAVMPRRQRNVACLGHIVAVAAPTIGLRRVLASPLSLSPTGRGKAPPLRDRAARRGCTRGAGSALLSRNVARAGILAVVVELALLFPGTTAADARSSCRNSAHTDAGNAAFAVAPNGRSYIYAVSVSGASCSQLRRVIGVALATLPHRRGRVSYRVSGYRCRGALSEGSPPGTLFGNVGCVRAKRNFRFSYTD